MEMDTEESFVEESVDNRITHFLRSFLCSRSMTKSETLNLYGSLFDSTSETGLSELISKINELITLSKLQIVKCICEVKSVEYYVLVSKYFKVDRTLPSKYTDNEVDYFYNIVKQIMLSEAGVVSSIECLNLEKKITKAAAECLMKQFVDDKYLLEAQPGKFTLSCMAILELHPYFEEYLSEAIAHCVFCKKIVVYSLLCPSCEVRAHLNCFGKYKSSFRQKPQCPTCNAVWTEAAESS